METYNKIKVKTGDIYGRYMIFQEVEPINYCRRFECICECGTKKIVRLTKLRSGSTQSCGCLHKEIAKKVNIKHNDRFKISPHHYLYYTWNGAKGRCYNPNNKRFKSYGERGITMYDEWKNDYVKFKEWILNNLGERPEEYSLDRINNNKGYEPNNLRWASDKEQSNNKQKK